MPKRRIPDLIARVYDAAIDEARWPTFLDELTKTLSSTATVLYLQNFDEPQGTVGFEVGVDPALVPEWNEHYSKVTIWAQRGAHLIESGSFEALNRTAMAVIVLDAIGHVVFANRVAGDSVSSTLLLATRTA